MDGRTNNKGTKGNNGGNPGHGKLNMVREKVKHYMPQWWTNWELMMNEGAKEDKRWAMTEFNKLQTKMMPTTFEDDEGNAVSPVLVTFLNDKSTNNDTNTK